MDHDTAESLRELLDRTRPACNAAGYPPEVRERVAAWLRSRQAAGEGWKGLARQLGITRTSARLWASGPVRGTPEESPPPAFLPIQVVDERPEPLAPGTAVLVSPRGYRVEGLGLAEIAALLERVG